MSQSQEPNTELRDFLRARRARVSPEEAGLEHRPGGTARRVPGLRREEVAQLAGVSVDYYVRLERGRHVNVSASVLDALARALRLNGLEREHLFRVARPASAPGGGDRTGARGGRGRPLPPQRVRPGLRLVLDCLTDAPALVIGRRMDVLASNAPARALYTDFDALPVRERNLARLVFLDEQVRALYPDWEEAARGIVSSLRLYAGRWPHDPALAELVGELSVREPDFRVWWADHDVYQRSHGTKRMVHPRVGELTLQYEALTTVGDPEQTLGISTAEPGSPSAERLRLLIAP